MAKKSKRILCALLSIFMVLTIIPMGAINVNAADSTDVEEAADLPDGQLVTPKVTMQATSVIRTSAGTDSCLAGNTIQPATYSGLTSAGTGGRTTAYYAGETPVSPTVTFTSDKSLAADPTISCENNANVSFTGPAKSGNTYTWTINSGAVAEVGALNFVVDYSYTYTDTLTNKSITKSYKAYATSSVEVGAQPGGMYTEYERTNSSHSNITIEWAWRILGANVFGGFYDGSSTDTGWKHGIYNWYESGFASGGDGSAAGAYPYSMVYHDPDKSSEGNKVSNTGLDGNRPYSTIYLQRGYALENYNIRASVYEITGSDKFTRYIRSVIVQPGEVTWDSSTLDNNSARNEIGLGSISSNIQVSPGSVTNFAMSGNNYESSLTDTPSGNKMAAYTIIFELGAYYSKSDQNCNTKTAVDLRIVTYDKEDLLAAINESVNEQCLTTPYATSSEAGVCPNEWFYSAGWAEYKAALQNAQYVYSDCDTNQQVIDAATARLQAAVEGLEVNTADYTAVNAAKDTVRGLNSALYTDESWLGVQRAVNAASSGYSIFFQSAVDIFAKNINTAIGQLEYRAADYSEVEALIESYGRLVQSQYTAASWQTLVNAINAVDYTITAERQSIVDGYRDSIATAIDELEYSAADYTALNAQVARYNQVLPQKDYYRVLLWRAVNVAYQSINWNLDWRYQSDVDTMTANLKNAIDNLEYDDADYSEVEAATKAVSKLSSTWYTTASWNNLMDKLAAVDYTLNKTQQTTVDGYATAINNAIDALVETGGDYLLVDDAIARANALNPSNYTSDSWTRLQNVIASVDRTKLARQQVEIDAYADNINNAINSLVEYAADYTAVRTAVNTWNAYPNKNYYTDASVMAVANAVNAVDYTLKISQQATVDAYAQAINDAMADLKLKKADYTQLDDTVSAARQYTNKQGSYGVLYDGHSYYTDETYQVLVDALNDVVYGLDITHQQEINNYITAIVSAYNSLEYNVADYTAVNVALSKIPADIDQEGLYDEELAANVLLAQLGVVEGLTSDKQDQVDAMAKAIEDAVKALKYKSADYSEIDELTATWASYPNKDSYTASSVKRVDDAFALVIRGYDVRQQSVVDAYADAIRTEINNLGVDVADYSKVSVAVAAATAAKSDVYTDESNAAVDTAINAVVYNLKSAEQERVNGFAIAINEAVAGLTYKGLDMTQYNAVSATIPADLSIYTSTSVNQVEVAQSKINTFLAGDKNITNQGEFDVLVDALDDAIKALNKDGADYTAVNEAIRNTTNLIPENYSNWSVVENAINDVVRDLDVTKQAQVDAMALAINDAVASLTLKNADYTSVEEAKANIPADLTIYREDSVAALNKTVNSVVEGLTIDKQAIVDGYATMINEAIDNLCYVTGDYSKLNALAASTKKIDSTKYSNYNEVYFNQILPYVSNTIPENSNYTIEEQDKIDAMEATLQGYIDSLTLKSADYTELNQAIATANEKIATGYYTAYSVSNLEDVMTLVDYSLDIEHQDDVDYVTGLIKDATNNLAYKPSDFSQIDNLYKEIKDMNPDLYVNYVDVYWGQIYNFYNVDVKQAKRTYKLITDQDKIDEMYATLVEYKNMIKSKDSPLFVEQISSTTEIYKKNDVNYIDGLKTGLTNQQFLTDYVDYANVVIEIQKSNSKMFMGTNSKVIVKNETTNEVIDEYIIVINGDINGDGKVDSFDYDMLNRIVAGTDVATGAYFEAADLNADGNIDGFDLTALSLILAGLSDYKTVIKNIDHLV